MADDAKQQGQEVEQLTSIDKIMGLLGEDVQKKGALEEFLKRIGEKHGGKQITGSMVDGLIAEIDEKLNAQMDAILHNEQFKALESTWRGLDYLVKNTKFSKPVKLELLDVTKEELRSDLDNAATGEGYEKQSDLWHHVYWHAYDKVGGHPYTAIIADYQFDKTGQDIRMLEHLSVLGESAQLPFIANAKAEFFGHENYGDVMNDRYLEEIIKDDDDYIAWRSFREDDRAKYIGLTLPRFLGRSPYSLDTEPIKNFNYEETVVEDGQDQSLWSNASFALAANMVKSFEDWGWSVKIVGKDSGGKVEKLPPAFYKEHGKKKAKVPVEASVGQAKDKELCDQGFIPLAHWDRTNFACFFEVPSVKRPLKIEDDDVASANSAIETRLQYIMLVTRIAHYLKYRQLNFVGRNAGAAEIKTDLSEWLDKILAEFDNPQEDVVARKPLRSYSLEVHEDPAEPGHFQIEVEFRPHVAIVGMDINLKLVAYHTDEQ